MFFCEGCLRVEHFCQDFSHVIAYSFVPLTREEKGEPSFLPTFEIRVEIVRYYSVNVRNNDNPARFWKQLEIIRFKIKQTIYKSKNSFGQIFICFTKPLCTPPVTPTTVPILFSFIKINVWPIFHKPITYVPHDRVKFVT